MILYDRQVQEEEIRAEEIERIYFYLNDKSPVQQSWIVIQGGARDVNYFMSRWQLRLEQEIGCYSDARTKLERLFCHVVSSDNSSGSNVFFQSSVFKELMEVQK